MALPVSVPERRPNPLLSDHAVGQPEQALSPATPIRKTRSVLWRLARYALAGQACILLGVYIGWETLPAKGAVLALLQTPPTDAETLSLYEAPDAESAAIDAHILTHPVSKALRANPTYLESRPHLKIPASLRRQNLTGGTLAGPGRIVVPPLQFVERAGKGYVAIFYLGPELCGHPGIIHGGLLATLLDEGLARCCFQALPHGIGVTANLRIDYRKPVMAEGYYVLRARTDRVEGRKAWVEGWIERLGDGGEEIGDMGGVRGVEEGKSKGQVDGRQRLVEAQALFIEPKNAKVRGVESACLAATRWLLVRARC